MKETSNIFQSVYYKTTYADPEKVVEEPLIAFTGRSNAGKSSLISAICNQKNLARAARTPGKTRNLNIFEGQLNGKPFYLCDLPGFGYANLPRSERERLGKIIESFFLKNKGLLISLILCDSARWPGEEEAAIDVEFHNAIGECAHNIILLHTLRSCYRLLSDGVFYNRSMIYNFPGARDKLLEQHLAIYDAVMAGDPAAARAAAQAHMTYVENSMRDAERTVDWQRISRLRLRQRSETTIE